MKFRDSYLARRRFLGGMIGGGAAALAAGMAGPLACYVGNLREEPPPEFLELDAKDNELAPGTSKLIAYGQIPVLMFRTPEPAAELKTFLATCTHLDCIVGYKPAENCIFCACHEGYYDLEGRVISGPPPRPLGPVYHALRGGKLFLALEKENLDKALEQNS